MALQQMVDVPVQSDPKDCLQKGQPECSTVLSLYVYLMFEISIFASVSPVIGHSTNRPIHHFSPPTKGRPHGALSGESYDHPG